MTDLVKTDESRSKWCPVPISDLEALLIKVISAGHGYSHSYALRKNIAYNLQHIEFLHKCLSDLKLTGVLYTQTYKTIILVGCGVLESLLYYLLVKKGLNTTTEWERKVILPGNQKNVDGTQTKSDSHIYTKLNTPIPVEMKFEAIIKKARGNKLLGSNKAIYSKLDELRILRNKVHLQATDNPTDTDWNAFNVSDVKNIDELLYLTFTSGIFRPSSSELDYFQYLDDYLKTP